MRLVCDCCARQIVSYRANEKHIVGGEPYRLTFRRGDVQGGICHECGKDLDEYGRFPEELAK